VKNKKLTKTTNTYIQVYRIEKNNNLKKRNNLGEGFPKTSDFPLQLAALCIELATKFG
jgi:hypothetical protein